ncbi:MAG: HAMP domain-containing sensor histidine kinase [Acutalibacteraceae bacterium]|nr:HAMP domain-containing sensor histidine kinase [Acutalibacteraceae bacterium]
MIKKLRIKLIAILTLILSVILIGIVISVNIINYKVNMSQSYERLDNITSAVLLQQRGQPYFFGNNENYFYFDSFNNPSETYIAFTGPLGNIKKIAGNTENKYEYNEIANYTQEVLKQNSIKGTIEDLIFTVNEVHYGEFSIGYVVSFMDNTDNIQNFQKLILSSVFILLIGIIIIFILSILLSMCIIKPIEEAFTKQKQFISDASHELKTPIAVISANAELLSGEIGENKWLSYIQSESERMSKLVTSLLTLTRIEMQSDKPQFSRFDICNAIMEITMPFESVAFESGISLECELTDKIFINGNEQQLKQVVAILTDNAIKHCYYGGRVLVNTESHKNKCHITVSNTGEPIPDELKAKIFERFFRSDESRHREENRYGLGLAIAKQIIDNHNGTITVSCEDGYTTFEIII